MLEGIFLTVVNMSIIGSLAIILILAVRLLLLKAPKVFSYCLWAVVLFRLLVPFSFDSVVSLIPINKQPVPLNLVSMQTPVINTGIARVDEAVSSALPSATNVDGTSLLPLMVTIMESIWLAVMLAMVVYGLYSLFKLKHKLSSALFIEGNIYQSEYVDTPFVLGIIKPKIYLPVGLNETEREYILLHEQNHIHRGDHIIRIVSYLALCIHWFNPLVWAAFKISGKDMEMANDESVIRKKGDSIKKAYSSSLLALSTGKRGVSPVPLAFGEEDPKGRIQNIINYKRPVVRVVVASVVLVVAISVGLLLSSDTDTANNNQINLEKMNAGEIVSVLNNIGYPVSGGKNYDDPGDASQYPWNIAGCTSAAEFWIPDGTENGESVGYVEVYSSVEACKTRRDWEVTISSFFPANKYYLQVGKVFLQVPKALTLQEAAQYQAALQAMAQGKLPEPYTAETTYYTEVVAKYYDLAYDIYLSMEMQDMSDVLDMSSIQNQNFVDALEANTIRWEYSIQKGYTIDTRERYPLYYDFAKIDKKDGTVIVTVDISGDDTQAYPPFVVFGENKFVLKQIENTWLITQHDYNDIHLFEISKTEKYDFELDKVRMRVDEEHAGVSPHN